MSVIDADMRRVVADAKLCFVATVRPDGSPNLSPKGSLRVYDDEHLAFMDIASPQTVTDLVADPRVEINAVDFVRRRGYRFTGTATLHDPASPVHDWLNAWLLEKNGPGYPAHQAVLVHVGRARPLVSPAYTYGGADERSLVDAWSAAYAIGATGKLA
ncbi:pyridoxamine 5'-phosphate oxidase family protein [Streptomyces sp. NPDC059063]|uniref:pyridoxamine 5'-phosphate oxidase family protein n=1 Tax=unclassified Streptomyces TaxID=2593676 RepID=UPI0036A8ECC5